MRHRSACTLPLLALLAAAPLRAQAPRLPDTPAGRALGDWLEAFNAADSARLDAYYRRYRQEGSAADMLPFRRQSGGFDLVSIERSEPRHLEFTMRERRRPMVGYGVVELAPAEPAHVTSWLLAIGPNASAAAARIDAAERLRVVEGAAARLDSFYVFPDVARRLADTLHARLRRGEYDRYGNGFFFAARLTDDLRAVGHDRHMRVNYSAEPIPPDPPADAQPLKPTAEELARDRARMDEVNCGFEKVEHLEDNIGYVRVDFLAVPEVCAPTASAAMTFVAGTRALILDLRENGGGKPAMVAWIASYLFSGRTHLNDLWTRRTGKTEEWWTSDTVPGRRFGGEKPVYVLTSSRTFSGGEELTYDLKTLKRATIVGETTGGGAHPVRGRRVDEHFVIGVPFARAINPVTHTNWEGTGVEPDVKVPAADALTEALRRARAAAPDAPRR